MFDRWNIFRDHLVKVMMKKFLQSSLLIVLLLGVSSPAKACSHDECGLLVVVGSWTLLVGTGIINVLAAVYSDSARRDIAEQKLPASDEKDTIKKDLIGGTVSYGISSAAGVMASMIAMCHGRTDGGTARVGIFGSAALLGSAVGMGLNGHAYHTAQAFFSDDKFNNMLGTSIAGLGLNVASAGLWTFWAYWLPKILATPVSPANSV